MLKQIFKSFVQVLKKRPVNTIINIGGLSIGLACFVLGYLFMNYKFSYDKFHEKSDRIVRVVEKLSQKSGGISIALNPPCLGNELKNNIPEVAKSTTINLGWEATLSYKDKIFHENDFILADEDFFEIFSFTLISKEGAKLLLDPYSIFMSETVSEKYFGDENPIGKIITVNDSISMKVVGVFEDIEENSHINFEMLIPLSFLNAELGKTLTNNWGNYNYLLYLLLEEGVEPKTLQTKVNTYFDEHEPFEEFPEIILQPLEDVYLFSSDISYDWVKDNSGGVGIVYVVIVTVLSILVLACINFMNLITAQSDSRAKEIGVRKVFGSTAKKLVVQLLGENIFQTLIAFFLAMVMAEIAQPFFNELMNAQIKISYLDYRLMLTLLVFALLTGIFAGLYPSVSLSEINPLKALQLEKRNRVKGGLLRKILVVFQFFVASLLIVFVIFTSRQVNFLLNKDLGYNKENLMFINIRSTNGNNYEALKARLLENPDIKSITGTLNLPIWSGPSAKTNKWEGNEMDRSLMMYHASVDYDYFETLEMEMLSGRAFSKDYGLDKSEAVILNEAAVKAMEMTDPIGKWFDLAGNTDWGMKGKIIGVVKDYNFDNARKKIQPLAIKLAPHEADFMVLRINPLAQKQVKEYVEKCWKEFFQHKTLWYSSLSDLVDDNYSSERSTKNIVSLLSIIAILISCLGLFGLVLFTIQKRTKEIGIRKVIGANSFGIIKMLSKEYAILILIGNILAAPLSYYYTKISMDKYEYHINIDAWPFLAALLISLLFALLTLIVKTRKAANSNPVEAIKYE